MIIHREGRKFLMRLFFGLTIAWAFLWQFLALPFHWLLAAATLCVGIFVIFAQFFRVPARIFSAADDEIVSPCDGKVVVIEQTEETEVLHCQCRQISVFMSPLNVHVNWHPTPGVVSYYRYHAGKYLVAWHPKSSSENERTTVVVDRADGRRIVFRQIAGALARRILCYSKKGDEAIHGAEFGFIKFGSRVDIFVPLEAKIEVGIGDKVKGRKSVLAILPKIAQ